MIWTLLFVVLVLVLGPTPARAVEVDFVCGVEPAFVRYLEALDPALVIDSTCDPVPEAETLAQRALARALPGIYLKKVGGRVALMTAEERQAADVALRALREELAFQDLCRADTYEELMIRTNALRQSLKGDIAAIIDADPVSLKKELTDIINKLVGTIEKLTRCDLARIKLGR